MPDTPDARFKVVISGRDRARLESWIAEAKRLGRMTLGREILAGLQEMQARLSSNPGEWGDPQYRLKELGLVVHHRLQELFSVLYAVDESKRIVFVKEIRARKDGPLDDNV